MTGLIPEGERPWTAVEVDAFTERTTAEVKAIQAESPGAARALLAERALAMVTKLTQGKEDSLRLEQQLRDQGAPAADIEKVRCLRDRIMTSAGASSPRRWKTRTAPRPEPGEIRAAPVLTARRRPADSFRGKPSGGMSGGSLMVETG